MHPSVQPFIRSRNGFEAYNAPPISGFTQFYRVVADKGPNIQHDVDLGLREEVTQMALKTARWGIIANCDAEFLCTEFDTI